MNYLINNTYVAIKEVIRDIYFSECMRCESNSIFYYANPLDELKKKFRFNIFCKLSETICLHNNEEYIICYVIDGSDCIYLSIESVLDGRTYTRSLCDVKLLDK